MNTHESNMPMAMTPINKLKMTMAVKMVNAVKYSSAKIG
jgi:hypothetical protein